MLSVNKSDTRESIGGGLGNYPPLVRRTILMDRVTRSPNYFDAKFATVLESARIGLADERHILNSELEDLLLRKFENPIAGIVGAHLLIVQHSQAGTEATPNLALLNEVVRNLRGLVGDSHPDVEAISLRCPDIGLRTSRPLTIPPMFHRSWRLMVDASAANPELVPESLWTRIHAATNIGGYLVWACDVQTQEAHLAQLKSWFAQTLPPTAEPHGALRSVAIAVGLGDDQIPSATASLSTGVAPKDQLGEKDLKSTLRRRAGQMQIPAAAFESLWHSQVGKGD
jgi:hypothetical protein